MEDIEKFVRGFSRFQQQYFSDPQTLHDSLRAMHDFDGGRAAGGQFAGRATRDSSTSYSAGVKMTQVLHFDASRCRVEGLLRRTKQQTENETEN